MKYLAIVALCFFSFGCASRSVYIPEVKFLKEEIAKDEHYLKEYAVKVRQGYQRLIKVYETEISVYSQLYDEEQERRLEEFKRKVIIELKNMGVNIGEDKWQ